MPTTAWKAPTLATNGTYFGSGPWTNMNNVFVNDSSWANNLNPIVPGTNTHLLRVSGFDFSEIPAGQKIDGIEFRAIVAGNGPEVYTQGLYLFAGDTDTASDHISGDLTVHAEAWPFGTGASGTITYGGPTNKLGTNLTVEMAKQSNFGIAIGAINVSGNNRDAGIQFIEMRLHYSVGTGGRMKVNLNGTFTAKPVKVWNGAAWVEKSLKYWDGTTWKQAKSS